jgi:uncharacterized protein
MDGLGLDREKDFEPHLLEKAADGPIMLAEGSVAAQWGSRIGWPGFTTIPNGGDRLIGLATDEIEKIRAKHNLLKPIVVPAGSYAGQTEPIQAVESWSYILGRVSLDEDPAYRFAKALDFAHAKLVQSVAQGAETRPEKTLAASPNLQRIHPGVLRYLADKDVDNIA